MGIASTTVWTKPVAAAAWIAGTMFTCSSPAGAGVGDLLVAPTRIVLDGRKGVEVILNNIGEEPAGQRSTFDEVRVFKAGVKDPVAIQEAVAVYTEIGKRHVDVPVNPSFKAALAGPVTVEYVETYDDGSHVIAQTQAVLR